MYRKYYSYNDMPKPLRENNPPAYRDGELHTPQATASTKKTGGFLEHIESDDIILGVIALLLIINDCDDKLLLLAIAFIFLSGLE